MDGVAVGWTVYTGAVEPEPKQFWMIGAGGWNLGSVYTTLVCGANGVKKFLCGFSNVDPI